MSNAQPQILPAPPASSDLLSCPFCGSAARLSDHALFNYDTRKTAWFVECQNYGECGVTLGEFASAEAAATKWNQRHLAPVLRAFYNEVCDQAERNMALTNTVSGAHWNAMRQVLKVKGIEVNQ